MPGFKRSNMTASGSVAPALKSAFGLQIAATSATAVAAPGGKALRRGSGEMGSDAAPPRKGTPTRHAQHAEPRDSGKAMEVEDEDDDQPEHALQVDKGSYHLLMKLSAQMALSAHHSAQIARAISVDVHLMKRSDQAITRAKGATKAYHDRVADLSKEEKASQDPPHLVAWDSLVMSTLEAATEAGMADAAAAIQLHIDDVTKMSMPVRSTFLLEHVRFCRVAPAFEKETAKLECAVRYCPGEEETNVYKAWQAMKKVLRGPMKAKPKPGMAPKTNIERRLTRLMTKMGIIKMDRNRNGGDW